MDTKGTIPQQKIHHGRNVRRFREMFGIKQEILAEQLGLSQQTVSRFESQEELDDATLKKIAEALKLPVDAFKNFSEETAYNIVANTFTDFKDNAVVFSMNPTFNPIDKIVELYDKLLQAEQEKVTMLQEIVRDKK